MTAWMHYFTFKDTDELAGYWVEIEASSNRKAEQKMEEIYGTWDKHYTEYHRHKLRDHGHGCLARYEVE